MRAPEPINSGTTCTVKLARRVIRRIPLGRGLDGLVRAVGVTRPGGLHDTVNTLLAAG